MKLTIIIPSFNSSNHIKGALNSILVQNFKNYEVLIIDNNSKDDTLQIIKSVNDFEKKISIIVENDKGIFDAMNKGVLLAKGEWLYFLGADDLLYDEQVLDKTSRYLNESNDIVYGDSIWVPDMVKEEGEWSLQKILFQSINHQRIFYRKSLFKGQIKYNIKYKIAADHALNIELFCNSKIRKCYVPIIISKYHSGGFSSNKFDVYFWDDWDFTFYENFKSLLPKKLIYSNLGIYCRYLIDNHKYKKTSLILFKVFINTFSLGFPLLIIRYWLNKVFMYGKS